MILITGAAGHLGNVLVRTLYHMGHKQLRFFVRPNENISHVEKFAKEVVRGDIRDAQAVLCAVNGCDSVFHLAGVVTVSNRNKRRVYDINHIGTKHVVQACLDSGVRRLVYASSTDALYHPKHGVVDETLAPDVSCFNSVYAKSKAMANVEVLNGVQKGLDAVIVCPSAVIGPHDYQDSMSGGVLNAYIKARKTQFYFHGTYDFIDVRDVALGMINAWEKGGSGQCYVLSGDAFLIEDVIKTAERCTGKPIRRKKLPVWLVMIAAVLAPAAYALVGKPPLLSKGAIDVLVADTRISSEKARRDLGFTTRSLEATIQGIIRWHNGEEV